MNTYGKELILDLKNCDPREFNRASISEFFDRLCERIDMEQGDRHFWDDVGVPTKERQTDPKTKGTSAVQFIITSNIVIHTLDLLGTVYLNLFSCKDFDADEVEEFTRVWFDGEVVKRTEVDRV